MEILTRRNLVILALVQTGIIVASVLGAGAAYKFQKERFHRAHISGFSDFWSEYGWLSLCVPLLWAAYAIWQFGRNTELNRDRIIALLLGVIIVIALLVVSWYAAIRPILYFPHGHEQLASVNIPM